MQSFNYTARRILTAALGVFVIVSCIDATVLWRTRDRHLGIYEDHFDKGVLLYETGSLSSGSKPMVLRPPGYPVFVAATLAVFRDAVLAIGRPLSGDVSPGGGRRVAILAAHAALLGLLGAAIVWFAIDRAGTLVAAACAVAVACNPLLLVMAGHVSYELLHLVLVAIATLMLLRRAGAGAPDRALFADGLLWGVATLVKSVTLIAPAFVLLWSWLHYGVRNAARTTVFFAAGLLLVVAPYTVRNYVVTDRFIAVNAQASFALWATSLAPIPPGAKYLQWEDTWAESAMKPYTEITGASTYSLAVFEEHLLELGDRFAVMARENLRRDPTVYVYNALHNSMMFVAAPPTSFWFDRYAFGAADARTARFVAGLSLGLMTVISVIATVIGCFRRDPRWTLVAALFAMMWASHALTFLAPRYLYIKLPTIAAGFVLACVVASSGGHSRWRRGAAGIATLAAVLSIVGLFTL